MFGDGGGRASTIEIKKRDIIFICVEVQGYGYCNLYVTCVI